MKQPGKTSGWKKYSGGIAMKKVIACVLLSALLCGAASAKSSGKKKNSEKQIVLKVLAGQSTTDAGIEKLIDKAVAKKYPDIRLDWECVDWGQDFHPKMQVYIQSGLPDIMIGKAQDVITYGSQDLLGDMTNASYTKEILPAAKTGVTVNNKVYGLTYNAQYQGVYYNRTLFKKYNITVPRTLDDLNNIIAAFKAKGLTPFATHFLDTWSIGNIAMQFAVNDVFRDIPDWGDRFRAGTKNFSTDPGYKAVYEYCKLIYDNTWTKETFSMEQTACDAKLVQGKAAMKVSGSWSIQNFLDIDQSFDFGIFPFPNRTGDSKLLFEPNITFMKSKKSSEQGAIDRVLDVIATDKELALEICNYTKTASMLKDVTPTFPNPSQKDIDMYAAEGKIQDVNLGNNQLQWGGFQDENAKDIAEYVQGKIDIQTALKAADARRSISKTE